MCLFNKNANKLKIGFGAIAYKLIFFLFFAFCFSTNAFSGSWNVVWQEDFGVVEDSVCRDFADPNMSVPGHKVASKDHLQDGYYGITNSTYWAFIHKKSVNPYEAYHFVPGRDHTGNPDGGMLVVNVGGSGSGENIYENNLKLNICGDHQYRLSMYVANVSDAILSPSLTLKVFNIKNKLDPELLNSYDLTGDMVVAWPGEEKNSRGLYIHKEREWTEASIEFKATEGDVLKIVITNNCSSGNGNDFAIDDIVLQRYDDDELIAPEIESYLDFYTFSCVPTYSVSNSAMIESWKKIYDKIYFLWQYSEDDGYTWNNILSESGIEKTTLRREKRFYKNEVYRVIVTGGSTEEEAQAKAEEIAQNGKLDNGCDYFSISNTISQIKKDPIPSGFVYIDDFFSRTNQPSYDCDEESHYLTLYTNHWDKTYSDYSFLWQYSYDELTWTTLSTTDTKYLFTDEFKGLTYFRVILATDETVLKQIELNGQPDNCDEDYLITNSASIECTKCVKPDVHGTIKGYGLCDDLEKELEFPVKQNNEVPLTEVEWYKKSEDDSAWSLLAGKTDLTLITDNPKVYTQYLFVAKNKKCVSDSIVFEVEAFHGVEIEPLEGQVVCAGEDAHISAKALSGDPTEFIWNDEFTESSEFVITNIQEDQHVTLQASNGLCGTELMEVDIKVEKPLDVTLATLPESICEGESVELAATVDLTRVNAFKWEKNGELLTDNELKITDDPVDDAIYKFTIKGNSCPSIEKEFNVKVEKEVNLSILVSPTFVCEGDKVNLNVTGMPSTANKFKWERENELISDIDMDIIDYPTEDVIYSFTVFGNKCPDMVYSFEVFVEKKVDITLGELPSVVCEGSSVDLVAEATMSNFYIYKWLKNGSLLTDSELSISDIVDEDATYKFVVDGGICPTVEKEIKVDVEKRPELNLTVSETVVCENADVTLTVESTNLQKLFLMQKYEGENQFSELSEVNNAINLKATQSATYKVVSDDQQVCESVSSNEVSITVEDSLNVIIEDVKSLLCEGESVSLDATIIGDCNSYGWKKNDDDSFAKGKLKVEDTPSGLSTYEFWAANSVCPGFSQKIEIDVEPVQALDLTVSKNRVCQDEEVVLSTNYPNKEGITWESKGAHDNQFEKIESGLSEVTVSPQENTTYRVSAVSTGGCPEKEADVVVLVDEPAGLTVKDLSLCEGDIAYLKADTERDFDQLTWNFINDSTTTQLNYLYKEIDSSLTYKVTAYSGVCEETTTASVNVVPMPHIISHEETSPNAYQMITDVDTETLYFDYNGSGKSTSNILENVEQGRVYKVVVVNELGCASDYTFQIPFDDIEFPKYFYQGEESWKVKNLEQFSNSYLYIYDRNGKLLLETDEAIEGWDGIYNGHAMPTTDYWFVLDLPEIDKQYNGHFTLMRR